MQPPLGVRRRDIHLSPNFRLSEFESGDRAPFPEEVVHNLFEVAWQLQRLRDALWRPLVVTSGYRSLKHNEAVGGAPASFHVKGMAADFKCPGAALSEVESAMHDLIARDIMRDGGIGVYPRGDDGGWIHYDIGPEGRRWNG